MVSKAVIGLVLFSFLVFGCTQQNTGTPQVPNTTGSGLENSNLPPSGGELSNNTSQELSTALSELEGLEDELAELGNELSDAQTTDDIEVLDVNDDLFK